jgi:hypothetical protein
MDDDGGTQKDVGASKTIGRVVAAFAKQRGVH